MYHTPTVFLVEDDPELRDAIEDGLKKTGFRVEACSTPVELLDNYDPECPGCLLLDFQLPDMTALELQDLLASRGSLHPFIVITGFATVEIATTVMRQGAFDVLEKPVDPDRLLDVVQRAIEKDSEDRQTLSERGAIRQRISTLTRREREILRLALAGKQTKEIAKELGIRPKTVEAHRAMIRTRMGVPSMPQLVRLLSEYRVDVPT